MAKYTTLLFDCDNTLVQSEVLAFEACADLANEILAHHGFADRYTGPQLMHDFVGQNFRGMMVSLQKKFGYEMAPAELEKYVSREEDQVIAKLKAGLVECDGAGAQLAALAAAGKYKMAVVSSSALRRVVASLEKADQRQYFPDGTVFSAATSLPKPTSKPDPAIYLHAMRELGDKAPGECLAVEDSRSGATSAFRAGIKTIGYVGCASKEEKEELRGILNAAGVAVIMEHWKEFPEVLEKLQTGA